jgi:hypothetical protein
LGWIVGDPEVIPILRFFRAGGDPPGTPEIRAYARPGLQESPQTAPDLKEFSISADSWLTVSLAGSFYM